MLVSDFASEYHRDLEVALDGETWFWFATRVTGLMTADTRLARYFTDD